MDEREQQECHHSQGVIFVDWSYFLTGGCLFGVTACLTLLFQMNTELVALRTKMELFRETYVSSADRLTTLESRVRQLENGFASLKGGK